MVEEGHALVFTPISCNEVMAISDRVTVLRDGKVIGTHKTAEMNRTELVK